MKRLLMLLVLTFAVMGLSSVAVAGEIDFAGGVTMHQVGTTSAPGVQFTFGNMFVTAPGDTLDGSVAHITGSFVLSSLVGNTGFFSPNGGVITMGGGSLGSLSGNVAFVNITGGSGSGFTINIGLSNMVVSTGTSALINSFANSNTGTGTLTFQFASNGASLAQLFNMGLPGGLSNNLHTSVSGSIAVPEPASLALFGSGLVLCAKLLRRRFAV